MALPNLLPRSTDEFGDAAYWDRFFAQGAVADFEWYTDASTLLPIIEKYIHTVSRNKASIRFLIPGCGTSDLPFRLHEQGYVGLYSCDYSDVALDCVRSKARKTGINLTFYKRDACRLSQYDDAEALEWFQPNSIDIVIDKGLLDSISSDFTEFAIDQCKSYLNEIKRLIKSGADAGVILIVTMAQPRVMDVLHSAFSLEKWMFTVHFIPPSQGDSNRYQPVVVAVVPRRLEHDDSCSYILDFASLNSRRLPDAETTRCEHSFEKVKLAVADEQQKRYQDTTTAFAKKVAQPPLVRRNYCIEVKPADIDTNLSELQVKVENLLLRYCDLQCNNIKTQPIAFGLQKLVLNVTVTNSNAPGGLAVDVDSMVEELQDELGEDFVQSIDLVV